MLSVYAIKIDGASFEIKGIISYELNRDIDAVCDSFRISFLSENQLDEIVSIKAYDGDRFVFNGLVDTQRESYGKNGFECFIYARSSACILVDNEAKPCTYTNPTALSLFMRNAGGFGFSSSLPRLFYNCDYQVNKGTSCYGAINNFVRGLTGKNIFINPDNELFIPSGDGNICLDDYEIMSVKRVINRGSLISQADYKINSNNDYCYHIKSRFLEEQGVYTLVNLNLSSLPVWQRETTAENIIKNSAANYHKYEVVVSGVAFADMYDSASSMQYDFGDYYISGISISFSSNGEKTKITLNKSLDLKEIRYVAE